MACLQVMKVLKFVVQTEGGGWFLTWHGLEQLQVCTRLVEPVWAFRHGCESVPTAECSTYELFDYLLINNWRHAFVSDKESKTLPPFTPNGLAVFFSKSAAKTLDHGYLLCLCTSAQLFLHLEHQNPSSNG